MRKVIVSCVMYYVYEAEISDGLTIEDEDMIINEVDGQDPIYKKICNIALNDKIEVTDAEIYSVMDAETGEILSE